MMQLRERVHKLSRKSSCRFIIQIDLSIIEDHILFDNRRFSILLHLWATLTNKERKMIVVR